jgi:hypothetical protein
MSLGPHYQPAQKFAEQLFSSSEGEDFRKVIDEAAKRFTDKVEESFFDWVISDAESNVQSHIWRTVDDMVKALLSGERWAMERYVLDGRYDTARVREAVAAVCGDEVQKLRIQDLEAEVKKLKEDVQWLRR